MKIMLLGKIVKMVCKIYNYYNSNSEENRKKFKNVILNFYI